MNIGDRIGNIRIEKRLGEGGMGEVFEGFDERLLRRVAVKALNSESFASPDMRARFLLEAQLLSKLDHPNICRIHDIEETDENDFLILELVEGQTLSERMLQDMPHDEKLRCARGIAEALDAAHQKGIIHRDLKPDNVMVINADQVKVLDFGIARFLDRPLELDDESIVLPPATAPSSTTDVTEVIPRQGIPAHRRTEPTRTGSAYNIPVTQRGTLVGTPAFMSPEQARGDELTQASDLYSLGILLQELFTGTPAYEPAPTPIARIVQVAEGASKPVEGADPAIVRLIEDLKSLDPTDRPTARETVERLDWILQGPVRTRRRRLAILGGAAVLALVVATAAVSLRFSRPKPLLLPGQAGRVLVLPFVNDTGDPANDWVRFGLMELVAQTLDASEGISVVSPEDAAKALEARGLSPDKKLPADEVLQILDGAGAQLGLAVRLERNDTGFTFFYTTFNVAGSVGDHSLMAGEPTEGANFLARRIAHRLRPESSFVEVFDRFSDEPLVNQIYAMGVASLHGAGATAARPYFEVALDRDPRLEWARIKLAECLETLGDGEGSMAAALAVLEAGRISDRPDLQNAALLQLALLTRRTGEYGPARDYYTQVLELATSREDQSGVADALKGLGAIEYFEGNGEKARDFFQRSLTLYRELGDRTGEMYSLGNLSALADADGNLKKAEELDTQALTIARETGNLKGIADYLNNLGVSARYQDQFDRAETLYRESLELQQRLGNRHGEANTLHNLGDLLKEQGRLEESYTFTRKALSIFEELDDFVGIGQASINLAECLLIMGHPDEAKAPLQRAIEWNPEASLVFSTRALQSYKRNRLAEARRLQTRAKALSDGNWRPIQQARLDALIEAERLGRPVMLPLEKRWAAWKDRDTSADQPPNREDS